MLSEFVVQSMKLPEITVGPVEFDTQMASGSAIPSFSHQPEGI
jgi:hypothetical protein